MSLSLAARALLSAAAGVEAEFIVGDLEEEFRWIAKHRGCLAGQWWYARQVVRSVAPLIAMRIRSGEFTEAMLRATLGILLPLWVLDLLWRFVHSQIPLKDGLERAAEFLAFNVIVLIAGTAISRTRPAAAAVAAGLATLVAASAAPPLYAAAMLLLAPASSWLAQRWRKPE